MISAIESQPAGSGLDLIRQVEEIFSPKGILSRSPNFEFRPQQQQMAVAAARALENGEHLAVEAGTGVGKSLAYLIPGGGSIQKVQWDDGPAAANQVTAYFDHPIVWGGN